VCAIQGKDSSACADFEETAAAHFFRNKSTISFTHVAVLVFRQDLNASNYGSVHKNLFHADSTDYLLYHVVFVC
jgi:hypothetical protein